jgi:copper resistance protein C
MNPARITASAGRTMLFAGLALVLTLGLFASPRAASAHAHVESSSPAAGSTVEAGLPSITITFDEEISVDASTARLEGPGGAIAGATASVDRANRALMTITTPPLSAGAYNVQWTAVTEDDNGTTNGTLSFTVAVAGAPAAPSGGSGAALPASGAGQINLVLSLLAGIALSLLGLGFASALRARA